MKTKVWMIGLLLAGCALWSVGQSAKARPASFRLDSVQGLRMVDSRAEAVTYKGRRAVHLMPPEKTGEDDKLAIVTDTDFKDGTIEVDVAGFPGNDADSGNRGFVGVAFRVQDKGNGEYFYLRPTNGRANDQLRRNHSVQYESLPDFPWHRLREEKPGLYESYADMEPGAWTKMKIVVAGTKARLYVNGAEQPCLIVNDLKRGESTGPIALWAAAGSEGYFSNLRVY